MDKTLFKAYVRELVREQMEESVEKAVRKILPEVLAEAVAEIKGTQRITEVVQQNKPKLDRSRLAALMGLERHGDTISAHTGNMNTVPVTEIPPDLTPDNPAVQAVTRDYSALMKKMGLAK